MDVDIAERMERAFLDYSMSVIVGRALPDVRDGLKPVQRRILHAMWEPGLRPGRPPRKCASALLMGKSAADRLTWIEANARYADLDV